MSENATGSDGDGVVWDPDAYATEIRTEIEGYDALQERVARATAYVKAATILELGTGSGETAARLLALHPQAKLVGVDSSAEMLAGAGQRLPEKPVTLVRQDLREALPEGRFDLIVSALAIHHLAGSEKAALFRSVAERLVPEGRFVMGDVVVPEDPADAVIDLEAGYDVPSTLDEQLRWLREAGLEPTVVWAERDLAIVCASCY